MKQSAPLRFVGLTLGVWTAARVLTVISQGHPFVAPADASEPVEPKAPSAALASAPAPGRVISASPPGRRDAGEELVLDRSSGTGVTAATVSSRYYVGVATSETAAPPIQLARADDRRSLIPNAPSLSVSPPATAPSPSRWSGSAWLFARGGDGGDSVAPGGEIGGSQAGGRVAYRLDDAGRFALLARGYAPLRQSGAEVSAGIEWHPVPRVPIRLAIERRQRVTRGGRSAWMASAIGGFYAEPLPGVLRIDGYAQAGIVGVKSRDLFADGSVRAGYPAKLGGDVTVTLGAGIWGAAQPDAKRLDIGPQATLRVPVDGATLVLAVDYRLRAAGRARPTSGPALTLGMDF